MSMSKASTFFCCVCRKERPLVPATPNTKSCFRCKLKSNKVLLLRVFEAMVTQEQMKEFRGEMEVWYLNDAA